MMFSHRIGDTVAREPHQGKPIHGPSWRRHGARRQRAARIARALRPVAHALGGLVSTELSVPFNGRWYRPDVGVMLDDPQPSDGVLDRAPALVVSLGGPLRGQEWLHAGAGAVWACDDDVVTELSRQGLRRLGPGQWLTHPAHPALRLAADDLAAGPVADARIGA